MANPKSVQLVHWKLEEVPERLSRLEAAGFDASHLNLQPTNTKLKNSTSAAAFLIDLSRLPSHGRAVAMALRQTKATRNIPLVFVEGDPGKVKKIRELFPDATYTTWSKIKTAVSKAIANPVRDPIVPRSESGPYSGTPLPKKLGIKADSIVVLVDAPEKFDAKLEPLPEGVQLVRGGRRKRDLTLWFVDSEKSLLKKIDSFVQQMQDGSHLWIAWPKKASGVSTDLSDGVVRRTALTAGLVDYKVCAIDETWSGLNFSRKKG
jgi:hypothetical protein